MGTIASLESLLGATVSRCVPDAIQGYKKAACPFVRPIAELANDESEAKTSYGDILPPAHVCSDGVEMKSEPFGLPIRSLQRGDRPRM